MDCLLTEYGEPLLAEDGECIEVSRPAGRRYMAEQAQTDWEARQKWRKQAEAMLTESVQEPVQESVSEKTQEADPSIGIDSILPRLYEPVESLAELVADARLLQLDEAMALESAMAVKDVLAIAELAYLAEVAVQQEKDAIAAFIMFMD